jgi:hypothetical protein
MAKTREARAKKCRANTTKGTRCTRSAVSGSDHCYQHADLEKPQSRVGGQRKGDSTKWVRAAGAAGLVAAIGGAGLAGKKILKARKGRKKHKK